MGKLKFFYLLNKIMADIVENVLKNEVEKEKQFKTIEVTRDIQSNIDVGNLLLEDINAIDTISYNQSRETLLLEVTRDSTQLLFNKIWELPTERKEDAVMAKLPEPTTILPREKPVPKPKSETRFERFARMKGMKKRKKDKLVYDEASGKWKRRHGYDKANEKEKNWMMPYKKTEDTSVDLFKKQTEAKKERVAKNELQRLRNIARASGMKKVPGIGATPSEKPSKLELGRQFLTAKKATASIGKFEEKLSKEKPMKGGEGKKRKFLPLHGPMDSERSRQLDVLKHLGSNKKILNGTKAASQIIRQEEIDQSKRKKAGETKRMKEGKRSKGVIRKEAKNKNYSKKPKSKDGGSKKLGGGKFGSSGGKKIGAAGKAGGKGGFKGKGGKK